MLARRMARIAALTVVTTALLTLAFSPAAGAEVAPGQQLIVAMELTAAGSETVTACQNEDFGADAESFKDRLSSALEFRAELLDSGDPTCLLIEPFTRITRKGRGNERVLRLETATLSSMIDDLGYREAFLVICTPLLSQQVKVFRGDPESDAEGCKHRGIGWDLTRPVDIEVSFNASSTDVTRGLMAGVSWWITLIVAAALAGSTLGRRYRLALLRARPWLAWILTGLIGGVAAYAWTIVAYRSHLLHAMQLAAGIGESGGTALLGIPATIAAGLVGIAAYRIGRDNVRLFPPVQPPLQGLDPSASFERGAIIPYWPPTTRTHPFAKAGTLPSIATGIGFLTFALTPRGDEVRVIGMLIIAMLHAVVMPLFHSGFLQYLYGAERMTPDREKPLIDVLQRMGSSSKEVWVCAVPPAAFPLGGSVLRAGKRAYVWNHAARLGDDELAAAIALRSPRKQGWILALFGLGMALSLLIARRDEAHVPLLVLLVPALVIMTLGVIDVLERIRVRTAERTPVEAERHIYGVLRTSLMTARLAAGGELSVVELQMPNVAEAVWQRGQSIASAIAKHAGLGDDFAESIATRMLATEATSLPDLNAPPPIDPEHQPDGATREEPPPAKKKRSAPAKKKPAAPKKKTAAKKTATRRAPAQSSRRPRS